MRLIFRPSARVSERWPSRVGFGSAVAERQASQLQRRSVAAFLFAISRLAVSLRRGSPTGSPCAALERCVRSVSSRGFGADLDARDLRLSQRFARPASRAAAAAAPRQLAPRSQALAVRANVDHQAVGIREQKRRVILSPSTSSTSRTTSGLFCADAHRFQQSVVDFQRFVGQLRIQPWLCKDRNRCGRAMRCAPLRI